MLVSRDVGGNNIKLCETVSVWLLKNVQLKPITASHVPSAGK